MSGGSFKDLNDFRRELKSLQSGRLIQAPTTPEAKAEQAIKTAVGELSQLWMTRLEYAKALIQAGVPDSEVTARAEALAVADMSARVKACVELHAINDTRVPMELRYMAHIVGVPLPKETPEATQPAASEVVNLHG